MSLADDDAVSKVDIVADLNIDVFEIDSDVNVDVSDNSFLTSWRQLDAYEYLKSEANNFYRTIYPFMHFKIKNELVLFWHILVKLFLIRPYHAY